MSREFGIYLTVDKDVVQNIAAPVFDWGRYYEIIVQLVRSGSWEAVNLRKEHHALNYWFGMSSGVIDVILSRDLSYASEKLVGLLKRQIISGQLSPFDGELHSQEGLVRDSRAPRLRAEEIVQMDWLNDNVIGEIPDSKRFTPEMQVLMKSAGSSFLR